MKNVALCVGLCALAASASAGTMSASAMGVERTGVAGYTPRDPGDVAVPVNLAGQVSWDLLADASNTVLLLDIAAAVGLPSGSAVSMTGIGWDVSIDTANTGDGQSWFSEARMYFDDNIAPDNLGLFLRVGAGSNFAGPSTNFSSGGNIDLTDAGIANILLPNGILRLELHETFDDVADSIDALFTQGGITVVATPAPGAFGLLGIGGLLMARRRR